MAADEIEISESRVAEVGGLKLRRSLPRRPRRTIGAWCFADHYGPVTMSPDRSMDIGPHPHIGLHTVTWLFEGEMLHTDSLGSEQLIRPGQLNLMTAGHGIAHAEETPTTHRGITHGMQLWVAQPEATRHGPSAFEHHAALPEVAFGSAQVRVLVGSVGDVRSPARADTPLIGADVELRPGAATIPLDPTHEHGVVVASGTVQIDGHRVDTDWLAYVPPGRDAITVETAGSSSDGTRLLLLGGEPFPDEVLMWWNFVARTRDEIVEAAHDWNADDTDRFAPVRSHLDRIPAPPTPWTP